MALWKYRFRANNCHGNSGKLITHSLIKLIFTRSERDRASLGTTSETRIHCHGLVILVIQNMYLMQLTEGYDNTSTGTFSSEQPALVVASILIQGVNTGIALVSAAIWLHWL